MRIVPLYPALLLALAASGCWVKKTTCRGLHSALGSTCDVYGSDGESGTEEPATVSGGEQPGGSGGVTPITEEVTETIVGPGFALSRVTPEQMSNNIVAAINVGDGPNELRFEDETAGQMIDYFNILFGVPLGGVDFQTATMRDPSTKAQTLLVARVIAAQFSAWSVWKEWDHPNARVIFTKCQMDSDRPFYGNDAQRSAAEQASLRQGETRWNEQVDELFWRLFSRPPTDAERAAVRTAFIAALDKEGYAQAGWITILYALLSTEEFWHV